MQEHDFVDYSKLSEIEAAAIVKQAHLPSLFLGEIRFKDFVIATVPFQGLVWSAKAGAAIQFD